MAQREEIAEPGPPLGYLLFENRQNDERVLKSLLCVRAVPLMFVHVQMTKADADLVPTVLWWVFWMHALSVCMAAVDVRLSRIFDLLLYADFAWVCCLFFTSNGKDELFMIFATGAAVVLCDTLVVILDHVSISREKDRLEAQKQK